MPTVQVGKISFQDSVFAKPVTHPLDINLTFKAISYPAFIRSPLAIRLDGMGNLLVTSTRPLLELQREFETDDYQFRIEVSATNYLDMTHTINVSTADWDAFMLQVEAIEEGNLTDKWQLLFDEIVSLSPIPVAAEVSLRKTNHQPLDPSDYNLEIIAPSSLMGVPVGGLSLWKFYPLPVADSVTVQVRLSVDDSVLASTDFGIDYTQTLNVWDLPINH